MAEPAELGAPLAEAAVLGCLLRMPPAPAAGLLAMLAESDWTVPQYAHVATAIGQVLHRGEPADPVTVLGQLRRQGMESARTSSRNAGVLLVDLCAAAPAVSNGRYYTRIVLEHSYRRRVQQAAVRLLHAVETAPLADLAHLVAREHAAVSEAYRRVTARVRSRRLLLPRPAPGGPAGRPVR